MRVLHARREYVRRLAITRDLSPHTIRAYDGDLRALEQHVGGDTRVDRIDRDCLVGFLEAQLAAGLAPRSVRRRASGVRGFCRWLLIEERLPVDPWIGVRISAGRGRQLPRPVPAPDVERLLLSLRSAAGATHGGRPPIVGIDPHEFTTLVAVALMVATAVRVGELTHIGCNDVDLVARRVRVLGKGRRERHVYLTNDWLVELLESYFVIRRALAIGHDRLLFNRHGDPLTPAAMRSRLTNVAREADVAGKVTPHMLRHSAATRLLDAGVDIRIIQRLLGHASLSTTEIYTHVSDATLQRTVTAADVLGGMLTAR